MHRPEGIFVVAWDGDREKTRALVRMMYPHGKIIVVEKRELRQSSLSQLIKRLRGFRGQAVVYCFRSLQEVIAPLALAWTGIFHRCRETVLVDEAGNQRVYRRWGWIKLLPTTLFALLCDAFSLVRSSAILRSDGKRYPLANSNSEPQIAYLFPHPTLRLDVGGAMSHVRGFLGGLKQAGVCCEIYTGRSLGDQGFPEQVVSLQRRPFFFWEARALGYNWRFLAAVNKALRGPRKPTVLYQRHSRFTVAGALLSRRLKVPLILEYNGSEVWVSRNWDPSGFGSWLRSCEEYSLRCAALITVVSESLKRELMQRGLAEEKILVNPNGVDTVKFQPGCGGAEVRRELGIAADDVVACFVGTFSYWHGVPILQEAADRLLRSAEQTPQLRKLRFLFIGEGPLRDEAAERLKLWVDRGKVIFTGSVPHARIAAYLDGSDILLSPHVPFSDGTEFFGSPTKLFEYMAMGKAIVASNLGQIGQVLSPRTGWLIQPGSADELIAAIAHLAEHPELRAQMGREARETAIRCHTWRRNILNLLERINTVPGRIEASHDFVTTQVDSFEAK